ncbi:RAQPRD family integrative conjugative element protein [Cysteiniphilum litorale]|uniref:RAQPRD family integrative conjugative element protein n=1 Tax=Cysteiniphilum litorale TaxID=2056700 RepID=UPI003F8836AB
MQNIQHSLTELRLFDFFCTIFKKKFLGCNSLFIKVFFTRFALLSSFFVSSHIAYAGTAESKIYLARADQLIHSAIVMVDKAKQAEKASGQGSGNTIFHYSWLEGDLADIRQGIQSYINDREMLPGVIHVLHKNYQCEGVSDAIAR